MTLAELYRRRLRFTFVIGWSVILASLVLLFAADRFKLMDMNYVGGFVIVGWFVLFCVAGYVIATVSCPRCKTKLLLAPFGPYAPTWWRIFCGSMICHVCGSNLSAMDAQAILSRRTLVS
jgi:hypothetical protein